MQGRMDDLVAIDIETIANSKVDLFINKMHFDAPANIKDEKKIADRIEEKRRETKLKAPLHWTTGQVFCFSAILVRDMTKSYTFLSFNELEVLEHFKQATSSNKLIGKNSLSFDFPFIIGRFLANNLPVPKNLTDRYSLLDVDQFFGFSSMSQQRAKLDNYAMACDYETKSLDGAKMEEYALDARLGNKEMEEKIKHYCYNDTLIVAKMAKLYYNL